jgi:protocatechuate 3,4-dioxygenase, alpha subunit
MTTHITTTQTIGPFPHEGWRWGFDSTIGSTVDGPAIVISGAVLDGDGEPISDAVLEAWAPASASADAQRAIPAFRRVPAGERGEFRFELPASVALQGEPVLYLTLFARGVLKHQFSAVFLEDDAALAQSALLAQVPAQRRDTLIAKRAGDREYRFDVRMQGERETVFFDYE